MSKLFKTDILFRYSRLKIPVLQLSWQLVVAGGAGEAARPANWQETDYER